MITACSTEEIVENTTEPPDHSNNSPITEPMVPENPEPSDDINTKPDVVQIMSEYKNKFNKLIDPSGKLRVRDFQTKKGVIGYLSEIMTEDLAAQITDLYFEEKNGGLYVIPKDGPIWLDEKKSFESERIAENKYRVTQEHTSELRGNLTFSIIFTKEKGDWIIEKFETERKN